MTQEPTRQPERFRVLRGRPAETPFLDLGEGVRIYLSLVAQSRQLESLMEELRGRILRAMAEAEIDHFTVHGVEASRQTRRYPPELDQEQARRLLERHGRLREAEKTVLDPEKAREVLNELFQAGKIRREDLPYAEPREVEALIVRAAEEEG